ncbi:MAG TPA: nuclear transport factor 2 family protein [Pyrinomonadaceae bacterium]|nr:nuclear transport factor 2 family protein [Pyrinomonadaceae bacterium]
MNLRTQIATLIILLTFAQVSWGRVDATVEIKQLEQRIEDAVVKADIKFLESVYANDFRFTHGDGEVQNKAEWLGLVAKREIVSRKIYTLDVEVHGNVAVTFGRLDTLWRGDNKDDRYALKYMRVYERRKGRWVLLSHRTVEMLKE